MRPTTEQIIRHQEGRLANAEELRGHIHGPSASEQRFYEPPRPVGHYRIGEGFNVTLTRRPAWLHRAMMRLLLGWQWVDHHKEDKP